MRGAELRPVVIAAGGTGGHFFPAEALAAELARRGCFVMLSNSDVPAMHELYAGWRLVTVSAARCINSSGAKRGPVGELLVKSW